MRTTGTMRPPVAAPPALPQARGEAAPGTGTPASEATFNRPRASSIRSTRSPSRVTSTGSTRPESSGRSRKPILPWLAVKNGPGPNAGSSPTLNPVSLTAGRGNAETDSDAYVNGRPTARAASCATWACAADVASRRGRAAIAAATRTTATSDPITSHFSMGASGHAARQGRPRERRARRGASAPPAPLRDQQDLAGALPSLEGPMRFGSLGQRELVFDAELELAIADPAQHVARALQELRPRGDVMIEARARHEQRAPVVEHLEIERGHGPARGAEQGHEPARPEAGEPLVERRRADTVVHHVDAAAAGDAFDLGLEVLLRVQDDVVGACGLGERRLLFRRDGADHRRAAHLRHLTQQESHPARRRVHQADVARSEEHTSELQSLRHLV